MSASSTGQLSLCSYLDFLAARTWNYLDFGSQTGIHPNEETLTDINLIDLQSTYPHGTFCRKHSKHKEGRQTGADWEWYIGKPGKWLRFRVQAKKRKMNTLSYNRLDYSSGYGQQVDLLLNDAAKNKFYPLYCFYNYLEAPIPNFRWNCCRSGRQTNLIGCAVADANSIKNQISNGRKGVMDILQISYPWSCLLCCHKFLHRGFELIDRTKAFLKEFMDADVENQYETDRLPEYVKYSMTDERTSLSRPDLTYTVVTTETELHSLQSLT